MPLLNFTTKISVDKTIGEIQECLRKHGASAVLTEWDDQGYITAVSFKMSINGQDIGFRLPTDWRPVLTLLEQDRKVARSLRNQDQALRVAWRITKDWVLAQMAIVETKMVTVPQVFLPYAVMKNGDTMFENIAKNPQLLLGN